MQLNDANTKRQNEILGRRAVIVAGATAFTLAVVKFDAGLIGGLVAFFFFKQKTAYEIFT